MKLKNSLLHNICNSIQPASFSILSNPVLSKDWVYYRRLLVTCTLRVAFTLSGLVEFHRTMVLRTDQVRTKYEKSRLRNPNFTFSSLRWKDYPGCQSKPFKVLKTSGTQGIRPTNSVSDYMNSLENFLNLLDSEEKEIILLVT